MSLLSSYGAIFRLEGTVINVDAVQKAAWDKVAEQEGFEEVDMEDVKLAQTMSPEKAIRCVQREQKRTPRTHYI